VPLRLDESDFVDLLINHKSELSEEMMLELLLGEGPEKNIKMMRKSKDQGRWQSSNI